MEYNYNHLTSGDWISHCKQAWQKYNLTNKAQDHIIEKQETHMVKPFDVTKFRKNITKSIDGLGIGFNDPTDWISTGNHALNYLISGELHYQFYQQNLFLYQNLEKPLI